MTMSSPLRLKGRGAGTEPCGRPLFSLFRPLFSLIRLLLLIIILHEMIRIRMYIRHFHLTVFRLPLKLGMLRLLFVSFEIRFL